jgi:hypothetical protein
MDHCIRCLGDMLPAGIVKPKTRLGKVTKDAFDPLGPRALPQTIALE